MAEPNGTYFGRISQNVAFFQQIAPLRFAVRFFVLWPDDPKRGRGTQFHHLEHITRLICEQSALAPGQGFEQYLVASYDRLSAAAGLFFIKQEPHEA